MRLNPFPDLEQEFQNRHRGERCVIMGNGPSLNRIDLARLRQETTFGLNKIFLLASGVLSGWSPSYYCVVNPLVMQQSVAEIAAMPSTRFIGHEGATLFSPGPSLRLFDSSRREPHFATTLNQPMWQGYTVTYCALQMAYGMGFSEVILVGVDHSYTFTGTPNKEMRAEGDDSNHFHPHYFHNGQPWNLPDLAMSEKAYAMAHHAFTQDGRTVRNATPGTQLTVFPRVAFEDVFGK